MFTEVLQFFINFSFLLDLGRFPSIVRDKESCWQRDTTKTIFFPSPCSTHVDVVFSRCFFFFVRFLFVCNITKIETLTISSWCTELRISGISSLMYRLHCVFFTIALIQPPFCNLVYNCGLHSFYPFCCRRTFPFRCLSLFRLCAAT